ncbi:MAG: hypothetical protein K6G37_00665 [Bacilli bacterium]|nr:hypothetical protein [Bacilli bacterium]
MNRLSNNLKTKYRLFEDDNIGKILEEIFTFNRCTSIKSSSKDENCNLCIDLESENEGKHFLVKYCGEILYFIELPNTFKIYTISSANSYNVNMFEKMEKGFVVSKIFKRYSSASSDQNQLINSEFDARRYIYSYDTLKNHFNSKLLLDNSMPLKEFFRLHKTFFKGMEEYYADYNYRFTSYFTPANSPLNRYINKDAYIRGNKTIFNYNDISSYYGFITSNSKLSAIYSTFMGESNMYNEKLVGSMGPELLASGAYGYYYNSSEGKAELDLVGLKVSNIDDNCNSDIRRVN